MEKEYTEVAIRVTGRLVAQYTKMVTESGETLYEA